MVQEHVLKKKEEEEEETAAQIAITVAGPLTAIIPIPPT